jgi:hypothetical protein
MRGWSWREWWGGWQVGRKITDPYSHGRTPLVEVMILSSSSSPCISEKQGGHIGPLAPTPARHGNMLF